MNGKGSTPRPLSVSREEFAKNWSQTFRMSKSFARFWNSKELQRAWGQAWDPANVNPR
jgi:hypothetical protein